MNTKTPILVTVLGLALLTGLAIAASTTPVPPPAPVPAPAGLPDEMHARIAGHLGLSADQQKALAELHAKHQAEMMALLTPEQQKKAGELRGHMMQRARMAWRPAHGFAPGRGGPAGRPGPAMQPKPPADPLAIVAMGDRIKDRMAEQLQLTDEQRDKLEHLGRAYRAQQRDAAKKHLEEMRGVLTPEQQQKAEQMKRHFNRGKQGGHPPFAGMNPGPHGLGGGQQHLPPGGF